MTQTTPTRDEALFRALIEELRPYAARPLGSIRIDTDDIRKIVDWFDASASAPAPASGMDAVLNLYREAVRIDVKMEGPQFMGANSSALKRAWEADRASLSPAATPVSEAEPVAAVVAEELALKIVSLSVNWLREDGTDREHDDYVRANWTKEIAEAKRLILAALAKPASSPAGSNDADA